MRPFQTALRSAAMLAAAFALLPLVAGAALSAVTLAGLVAIGAAYATARLAERQIGGLTGDVMGAAQQTAEIAALLAFAR
jgi:adenosylcobinamide-GDP ribazoletransferase